MGNAILGYILKLKFLDGYRTYIAGIGLLCLAIYSLTQGQWDAAMTQFFMALAGLGIYEKAKATNDVVTPAASPASTVPGMANPVTQATEPSHPVVDAIIAAIEERLKQRLTG